MTGAAFSDRLIYSFADVCSQILGKEPYAYGKTVRPEGTPRGSAGACAGDRFLVPYAAPDAGDGLDPAGDRRVCAAGTGEDGHCLRRTLCGAQQRYGGDPGCGAGRRRRSACGYGCFKREGGNWAFLCGGKREHARLWARCAHGDAPWRGEAAFPARGPASRACAVDLPGRRGAERRRGTARAGRRAGNAACRGGVRTACWHACGAARGGNGCREARLRNGGEGALCDHRAWLRLPQRHAHTGRRSDRHRCADHNGAANAREPRMRRERAGGALRHLDPWRHGG